MNFGKGLERGRVEEVFGAGTAAVVAPIQTIGIDGMNYSLPVVGGDQAPGKSVALFLKSELDAIRYGRKADKYGWNNYID